MAENTSKIYDYLIDDIVATDNYSSFMVVGDNDVEGNQIFTPGFICDAMINMTSMDDICDIHKSILEPSSGDGAFTVRILEYRLKKIFSDENYFQESLVALSNIFSIEIDKKLMSKQRNNIYTLLMIYANQKNNIPVGYSEKAQEIIRTNFIWGESNIDCQIRYYDDPIGWYMPTNKKHKIDKNRIRFANWSITENIVDSFYVVEDWDREEIKEDYSTLGGLFADE